MSETGGPSLIRATIQATEPGITAAQADRIVALAERCGLTWDGLAQIANTLYRDDDWLSWDREMTDELIATLEKMEVPR